MTGRGPTLEPAYFEAIYADNEDPWGFRTSGYEAEKYAATLESLGRERYERGLEIGCSIGVFTRQLAYRCEALLAIDVSERALAAAREECRDLAHVRFLRAAVPAEFPREGFDLIVLSEVLYYLAPQDLEQVADLVMDHLRPGGDVVLCHWLGGTNYPLSGEDAATRFIAATLRRLRVRLALRRPNYRLERLSDAHPGE